LYDKLKKSAGFPLEMIFELDNICNLECSMCNGEFSSSILKNRDHLQIATSPYGSDFFEQIKPYLKHLSVAKFLGGEPFLIKGYYEIWEELIKHNPKCFINLQTNGTIYNSRIEDLLKRGRFQIGVSIDSLNPELFEKIRKNSSLSEVLKNLDKFINLTMKSGSFVNVSVCPMQENWMEVPQIVNFCNRKNVFIYFNTVYSKGFNLQEFDAARLKAIIDLYKQSQISARTYINRRNKKFFLDLINQVELWYKNKYELEQTYLPRWEYTHENLIAAFKNKLSDDYLHFEFVILAGIDCLPERMLLNDFQKRMLEEINKEDLILSLVNETHGQIKQRLINFIEKSTFNIEI
jgi:molybdenum cofactor biosynthesis enzyme MoaA